MSGIIRTIKTAGKDRKEIVKMKTNQTKFDSYQMATDQIVELLEKGLIPWNKPWGLIGTGCWSRATKRQYSFLNTMLIAGQYAKRNKEEMKDIKTFSELLAIIKGEYLTFNQIKELGGSVKKGEQGFQVVFFKWLEKDTEEVDENGDTITKKFPVLKTYTVFNVKQCKDIEQKHYTDEEINEFEKDLTADGIVVDYLERTGVKLEHVKQNEAFYRPSTDSITMPLQEQFKTAGDYYSTLFHEITHSTGHKTRLDRISEMASFGSADYSTEELVAEIGSASILSTIGLQDSKTLEQSASYCKSWLKALKNDKKMIVIASARAEKAIQLILGI